MNYCYAITGVFVPTNMPMSLLSYKYLRGLNMPVDVVAMNHTVDQSLVEKLSKDPKYKNMHVSFKGQYNDALFSKINIQMLHGLPVLPILSIIHHIKMMPVRIMNILYLKK